MSQLWRPIKTFHWLLPSRKHILSVNLWNCQTSTSASSDQSVLTISHRKLVSLFVSRWGLGQDGGRGRRVTQTSLITATESQPQLYISWHNSKCKSRAPRSPRRGQHNSIIYSVSNNMVIKFFLEVFRSVDGSGCALTMETLIVIMASDFCILFEAERNKLYTWLHKFTIKWINFLSWNKSNCKKHVAHIQMESIWSWFFFKTRLEQESTAASVPLSQLSWWAAVIVQKHPTLHSAEHLWNWTVYSKTWLFGIKKTFICCW